MNRKLAFGVVTLTIKYLTRILCRVDDAQLARVPQRGPLILVANHINFLEVPLLFTHLQPRPVAGLAKSESWDHPVLRMLFDLWGGIPIHRGEADRPALHRGLELLKLGYILAIAPEGTRSHHGRLQRGRPGVVWLALHSKAPILPVAYHGSERFHANIARLSRTNFHIRVGRPFYLDAGDTKVTRQVRQQMLDEIMYQIATLLPPEYRGCYSDVAVATTNYLRFAPDAPAVGEPKRY